MSDTKIFTGALGIIKVNGVVIGKARSINASESIRRVEVVGIGTILPSEAPPTGWAGTCSVSFMSFLFKKDGLPGAIKRIFPNIASQVFTGESSFEDQLVLDDEGITMDIFKKVADAIDPATGNIKPKAIPYATIRNMLIESDGFDLSEGQIAGRNQSFKYLTPITSII